MRNCPFCSAQHDETLVLAANKLAYAILDIAPIRPGHALVMPREHVEDFFALNEETQGAMLRLANELAGVLREVCRPERVGMILAGFDVPHAHLHLIPVHSFLDLTPQTVLDDGKKPAPAGELQAMREQLRLHLKPGAA